MIAKNGLELTTKFLKNLHLTTILQSPIRKDSCAAAVGGCGAKPV